MTCNRKIAWLRRVSRKKGGESGRSLRRGTEILLLEPEVEHLGKHNFGLWRVMSAIGYSHTKEQMCWWEKEGLMDRLTSGNPIFVNDNNDYNDNEEYYYYNLSNSNSKTIVDGLKNRRKTKLKRRGSF